MEVLIGKVVACVFVVYILACFILGSLGKMRGYRIRDEVDIGYIRPSKPLLGGQHRYPEPKEERPKPPPAPPKEEKRPLNSRLYEDCVNALVALGYKRSTAKAEAKEILAKNDVKRVEDFIPLVFKNVSNPSSPN